MGIGDIALSPSHMLCHSSLTTPLVESRAVWNLRLRPWHPVEKWMFSPNGQKRGEKKPSKSPSNLVVCHHFEHLKKGVSAGTGESHDEACASFEGLPRVLKNAHIMSYGHVRHVLCLKKWGTPKTGLSFEMAINPHVQTKPYDPFCAMVTHSINGAMVLHPVGIPSLLIHCHRWGMVIIFFERCWHSVHVLIWYFKRIPWYFLDVFFWSPGLCLVFF